MHVRNYLVRYVVSAQDALEVTQRVVDMTDDLFGRKHGVYASALNDQALMLKSIGQLAAATDTYLKALEVNHVACRSWSCVVQG